MMNSELVVKCSSDLATTVLAEPSVSDAQRLQRAYSTAYGREPTTDEIGSSLTFLRDVEQAVSQSAGTPEQHRRSAWDSLCHILLSSNEFIYVK